MVASPVALSPTPGAAACLFDQRLLLAQRLDCRTVAEIVRAWRARRNANSQTAAFTRSVVQGPSGVPCPPDTSLWTSWLVLMRVSPTKGTFSAAGPNHWLQQTGVFLSWGSVCALGAGC